MNCLKSTLPALLILSFATLPAFPAFALDREEESRITGDLGLNITPADQDGFGAREEAQRRAKAGEYLHGHDEDYKHLPNGQLYLDPRERVPLAVLKDVKEVIPRAPKHTEYNKRIAELNKEILGSCGFLSRYTNDPDPNKYWNPASEAGARANMKPEDHLLKETGNWRRRNLLDNITNRIESLYSNDHARTSLDQAALACDNRDLIREKEGSFGSIHDLATQSRPRRIVEYVADLAQDKWQANADYRNILDYLSGEALHSVQGLDEKIAQQAESLAQKDSLGGRLFGAAFASAPSPAACASAIQDVQKKLGADQQALNTELADRIGNLRPRCTEIKLRFPAN
jgi:hypothetical protein